MKKHIAIPILVIALVLVIGSVSYYEYKHGFTTEKWNGLSYNDRQHLAKDFIRQYKNDNLSKSEIVDLLGVDTVSYEGYYNRYKTDDNLTYDFGGKQSIFPSGGNMVMVIEFDENDIACSYDYFYYSW